MLLNLKSALFIFYKSAIGCEQMLPLTFFFNGISPMVLKSLMMQTFDILFCKSLYCLPFLLLSVSCSKRNTEESKQCQGDFLQENRKRIINALLPVIIIRRLLNCQITSPTKVVILVKEKFNINVSSGTIYPIFQKLEKQGLITRKRNSSFYVLTNYGKREISSFGKQKVEVAIQNFEEAFIE